MKSVKLKNLFIAALSVCFSLCALLAVAFSVKTNVYADVSSAIKMQKGASLLLQEESGLSFSYEISDYAEDNNYGMVIVPFDYLGKAGISLTDGNSYDYVSLLNQAYEEGKLLHEPSVKENIKPNSYDNKYIARFSIKNILENNYAREFFGIGFIKTASGQYEYAEFNDNVRSVFEVANIAANRLQFNEWDEADADALAEKELLTEYKTTIDGFITKSFEFVYGSAQVNGSFAATAKDGETSFSVSTEKLTEKEAVELSAHWHYTVEDDGVAAVTDGGALKGITRGKTTVTASIGNVVSAVAEVKVFKDATELEIYKNSNANFFDDTVIAASDAFGFATLNGGSYNSSSSYSKDTGYIGFKNPDSEDGKFTLDENGVYTEFYFTGNNMPNVEFFASDISGSMWKDSPSGSKGFVVTNGTGNVSLYSNFANYKNNGQLDSKYKYNGIVQYEDYFYYYVSYYDKYVGGGVPTANATELATDGTVSTTQYSGGKWVSDVSKTYSLFSMWNLMQDETQKWHYVVGMYKTVDGRVFADAKLYKVGDAAETLYSAKSESIKISASQSVSEDGQEIKGYIVAHSAIKGSGDNAATKLSYKLPYAGAENRQVSENAVFNQDGSVTLKSGYIGSAATPVDEIKNMQLGYVALSGAYKLGTYIDFYFKGNNMPLVSMFTKYVTNNLTNDYNGEAVNTGVLILNGVTDSKGASVGNKKYQFEVYAPDRIDAPLGTMSRAYYLGDSKYNASNPYELSMAKLATMPEQWFKYTVGICETDDGKLRLLIDMDKTDEAGNKTEDYFELDQVLYKGTASDMTGDRIIVYGALNGGTDITFRYGTPYTK